MSNVTFSVFSEKKSLLEEFQISASENMKVSEKSYTLSEIKTVPAKNQKDNTREKNYLTENKYQISPLS